MVIRQAKETDYNAIYELVKTAFETAQVSDGTEQDFVNQLRSSQRFIPALELVIEENNELIGHILLTKQSIEGTEKLISALLLAPLCICLEKRNKGLGGKLLMKGLETAGALGYQAAFLVGNPAYYERFGFQNIMEFGIHNTSDLPTQYVMAYEIVPGALKNIEGASVSLA